MPITILMPALSPTMKEGNLTKWLKKEGDTVYPGDVIAEIETDKATMEVEAVDEGKLAKILVPEHTERVAVNQPIAVLLLEGEDPASLEGFVVDVIPTSLVTPAQAGVQPNLDSRIRGNDIGEREDNVKAPHHRVFISPLAKRIAAQNEINTKDVEGSGPSGRIIKTDIDQHIASKILSASDFDKVWLSSMRKVIGARLTESKQRIPHFYLTIDVEVEKLIAMRGSIDKELKITINDFIIKASAIALLAIPAVNSTFHADFIKIYKDAHIAIAVAIEDGLITPIIQSANRKSLLAISSEIKTLAQRAKDGKLKPEEYQGGSFTISNLGMFGIKDFQAIINPPQTAILAVGTVQKNNVMSLTLSADHRAIDGAQAAQFLAKLKEVLENPIMVMVQ